VCGALAKLNNSLVKTSHEGVKLKQNLYIICVGQCTALFVVPTGKSKQGFSSLTVLICGEGVMFRTEYPGRFMIILI